LAYSRDAGDYKIDIRRIAMVGHGNGPITGMPGAPGQFRGDQFSITEEAMRMQIDHGSSLHAKIDSRVNITMGCINRFLTAGQ
jgi:hypothetical protein